jgi:Polyketide cyclase / dehydrase and lipid transport
MKPVRTTIDIGRPVEDVYDHLDVMANHEPFTNHMLRDWEYSGPPRGVGSKARVRAAAAGRSEVVDIEVIDAQAPTRIVERNIGAGGRRRATGTYLLEPLDASRTRVTFEYAWETAPLAERLAAPATRALIRRLNGRALARLAEQLAA